jgi:hypothetical protein
MGQAVRRRPWVSCLMTTPDASAAARALAALRPTATYTCVVCDRPFETFVQTGSRTPRYCGNICKQRAQRQRQRAVRDQPAPA